MTFKTVPFSNKDLRSILEKDLNNNGEEKWLSESERKLLIFYYQDDPSLDLMKSRMIDLMETYSKVSSDSSLLKVYIFDKDMK